MGARRVTLREAAQLLGVSKDAVRQRVRRGTLRSDKGGDGRVYVYLDASLGDVSSQTEAPEGSPNLVDSLRDQAAYLRDVISTRDEEIRRRDVIISQLTNRMPQIEPPTPEDQSERQTQPRPSSTGTAGALRIGASILTWMGGVFGPLAVSVLSVLNERFRLALVFGVFALLVLILIAIGAYLLWVRRHREAAFESTLQTMEQSLQPEPLQPEELRKEIEQLREKLQAERSKSWWRRLRPPEVVPVIDTRVIVVLSLLVFLALYVGYVGWQVFR